jgi:hypothetical protein
MAGKSEAGVCGTRPKNTLFFLLDVHATLFQVLMCAKKCTGRAGEHICRYIHCSMITNSTSLLE